MWLFLPHQPTAACKGETWRWQFQHHLQSLHVFLFDVGSTSKSNRWVGKFPYQDISWRKSHLPNRQVCFRHVQHAPHILLVELSTKLKAKAIWFFHKKRFFHKKLLSFSQPVPYILSFCFNNKSAILRPLELLQSLSSLSDFNYFLKYVKALEPAACLRGGVTCTLEQSWGICSLLELVPFTFI